MEAAKQDETFTSNPTPLHFFEELAMPQEDMIAMNYRWREKVALLIDRAQPLVEEPPMGYHSPWPTPSSSVYDDNEQTEEAVSAALGLWLTHGGQQEEEMPGAHEEQGQDAEISPPAATGPRPPPVYYVNHAPNYGYVEKNVPQHLPDVDSDYEARWTPMYTPSRLQMSSRLSPEQLAFMDRVAEQDYPKWREASSSERAMRYLMPGDCYLILMYKVSAQRLLEESTPKVPDDPLLPIWSDEAKGYYRRPPMDYHLHKLLPVACPYCLARNGNFLPDSWAYIVDGPDGYPHSPLSGWSLEASARRMFVDPLHEYVARHVAGHYGLTF